MKRLLKGLCLLLLATLLVLGIVLLGEGWSLYHSALETQSVEEKVAAISASPDYTPLDQLPESYRNAVVAVEDHRFYSHGGIDPIAIGRALWHNLEARSFKEGGSTITQQLAKNLFFTQEKQLTRKVAEMFMAFKLESLYTKDEILELYVNSIYFGDGYYCVRAASRGYFGKEPSEMTDAEATLLAGIPNAPSVYSLTENPELAFERQDYVLRQMLRYGYLTQAQAAAIRAAQ